MKTQVNKTLSLKKGTVTELNNAELLEVNGGTSVPCGIVILYTIFHADPAC
jgi:hypothetical protein